MPAPFQPSGTAIPLELLTTVIGHLDPEHDSPTLARLARCSKACHELAIPVLYKHLHFYTDRQVSQLLSDLSLEVGADGTALPCPTLTDIPVRKDRTTAAVGKGTRKLSHLRHTRYVSLHFVPDTSAIPFDRDDPDGPVVWIQVETGELKQIQRRLFPRVRGVALGKGFIPEFVAWVADHHGLPCTDPHHNVPDDTFIERCHERSRHHPGINKVIDFFSLVYHLRCWNLDDIPGGLCELVKRELVQGLIDDDIWGYTYKFTSHSTFPRTKLAPWTRVRAHWRHYIAVHAANGDVSGSNEGEGLAVGLDGNTGPEVAHNRQSIDDKDDNRDEERDSRRDHDVEEPDDTLLLNLTEDVYTIASEALESVAYGDKPRRRDMVYSGLSPQQVRTVEQKFVEVVSREFDDPDDVIVDPSLSIRKRSASTSGPPSDHDEDKEDEYDPNGNRYGDGGSDPEDEDAVRDYQKRVQMFDFFHATQSKKCECCGAGEGRVQNIYSGPFGF